MAAQVRSASRVVIALVRMQLRGPAPRPSTQSFDCWECIDALFEHHGVLAISATDQHHQRNTPGVYDDVPLGAELASVRRIGACFLPLGGLAPMSHRCWPGSNQAGRARASESAWPRVVYHTHLQHSSPSVIANRSYRCPSPMIKESLPTGFLCAARIGRR